MGNLITTTFTGDNTHFLSVDFTEDTIISKIIIEGANSYDTNLVGCILRIMNKSGKMVFQTNKLSLPYKRDQLTYTFGNPNWVFNSNGG